MGPEESRPKPRSPSPHQRRRRKSRSPRKPPGRKIYRLDECKMRCRLAYYDGLEADQLAIQATSRALAPKCVTDSDKRFLEKICDEERDKQRKIRVSVYDQCIKDCDEMMKQIPTRRRNQIV